MEIELTEPQDSFIYSDALFPAIVGGLGSGKSQAGTFRLMRLLFGDPGANGAYYMPTYDLINLRAIPGMELDLEHVGIPYKTNKSSYTISIEGYGDIIFRSYDRPERIIAYEVAHSICDELDTLPKDKAALVWRKITERNRQKRENKNTIGLVTTPDQGINGFVYEKWVKKQQPGYVLYKASTYSNPFLPPDYAESILANYDPILADLYLNGEFVSLTQNKVYHFFDRKRHHYDRVINKHDLLHIGLDFNIGGCCASVFVIDNNQPIAVDEFVSHDTRDFVNNLTRYKDHTVIVYPDASGRSGRTNASESDIQIIEKAGYQVSCNSTNPAVRDRINAYNGLLSHDRMKVNTDKCPNLTNALESQGYDVKGDPEKWNTHPSMDDWCFSGDTRVIINGKEIDFKDIPDRGVVLDFCGIPIQFTNGGIKGLEKLFEITLKDGTVIKVTGDHKFLTLNGWRPAYQLNGETLCNTQLFQTIFRNSTEESTIEERTGIFTKHSEALRQPTKVGREIAYTGQYGKRITALFLAVTSFITKMKTRAITALKTSILCCAQIITRCTLLNGIKTIRGTEQSQSTRLRTNVGSGTSQKQDCNGISSIMKKTKVHFIKLLNSNAINAEKFTQAKQEETINSARKIASRNRGAIAELITNQGRVRHAAKRSIQASIQTENTVVVSVKRLECEEPVYCLTTNDGAFSLANGMVVSNCDSSGYFLAYKFPVLRPMTNTTIGGI